MLLEVSSLIDDPPLDSCQPSNPLKTKKIKKAIKIMRKVKNGECLEQWLL